MTIKLIRFEIVLAIGMALLAQTAPAQVNTSWKTNSGNWGDATWWTAGVPGATDNAWLTNNVNAATTITNFGVSYFAVNNLVNSNVVGNTLRTITLLLSNQTFAVNDTLKLSAGARLQVGVDGTGLATAIVNRVVMDAVGGTGNQPSQIIFGRTTVGVADSLIITGSFVNTSANVISTGGGDWNLVYSNNSQFVNAGTINALMSTANGNGNITIGSSGLFTNTLRNTGLILIRKTSGNNSVTNTILGGLVNQGSIVISNQIGSGVDGRVFFNVIAPGQAVTNDVTGVWTLFSSDLTATATGTRNTTVNIANANFVNRGILTSDYRITNAGTNLKTNTFALSAGQVFSNAPGGQVIVAATSDPTRTTFLIRADRIVNAGTNLIAAGALSLRNSAGSAAVPLENSGLLRVDGTLVGASVTNSGRIQGTGVIAANVFNVSGGTLAPGNSLGTQTINGNAAFGSNATFAVELSLVDGTSDRLVISGGLTLAAFSVLDITGGAIGNVYTVATFQVSSLVGNFGTVTSGYAVGYDNAGGVLTLAVVPEPSSLVLVGAGLCGLVVLIKRRRV